VVAYQPPPPSSFQSSSFVPNVHQLILVIFQITSEEQLPCVRSNLVDGVPSIDAQVQAHAQEIGSVETEFVCLTQDNTAWWATLRDR
jgi:hypothetical protein